MGTWFLGYLKDRYNGDERLMLAAYNSEKETWTPGSPTKASTSKDIPYKETREYVDRARGTKDLPGTLRQEPARASRIACPSIIQE